VVCDNESEDDGEKLPCNEVEGKEDCVSDILIRADVDNEAYDDGDKLSWAKRVDVIVLHAVIESL
jgi:hypothetical protein